MSEVQRILADQSAHPHGSPDWFKHHAAYWRAVAREDRRLGFVNSAALWDEEAERADQGRFQ